MAVELGRSGASEGIRVLDDFTCSAIVAAGVPTTTTPGMAVNANMGVLSEVARPSSPVVFCAERVAELQGMSNAQLLALVQLHARELSAEELRLIHDLAINRMIRNDALWFNGAEEVSREAMRATLNRLAS